MLIYCNLDGAEFLQWTTVARGPNKRITGVQTEEGVKTGNVGAKPLENPAGLTLVPAPLWGTEPTFLTPRFDFIYSWNGVSLYL